MTMTATSLEEVSQRLGALESKIDLLVQQKTIKEWYTTAEVAAILDKAEFTVREWCRLKRIRAKKQQGRRGPHQAWVVSHEELTRYRNEGLLLLPE
jgi:hypothetical protein